jgi:CubicO group peptidase (beta-lactamase class C family)
MQTTRRTLLIQAVMLAASGGKAHAQNSLYDAIVGAEFAKSNLVGLQAGVIEHGAAAWSGAYGFADAQDSAAMTPDTVINIASVSKTVTAAAVMRLVERHLLGLDDDVNSHLPFAVHNPYYDTYPITVRSLLAHTSSINDSPEYARSYVCGTPRASLADWLKDYLVPGGAIYSKQNFHPWPAGEKFAYSNVAFGVLGCVVETVSGRAFSDFCDAEIFQPLGMARTSVGPAKVSDNLAVDYTLLAKVGAGERVLPDTRRGPFELKGATYLANCTYNFPTASDGLVRTSVRDFAQFVCAILGTKELLQRSTRDTMFSEQFPRAEHPSARPVIQGLAWYAVRAPDGSLVWLHTGTDPGVATVAMLHRPTRSAVVMFANSAPADGLSDLAGSCLRAASQPPTRG